MEFEVNASYTRDEIHDSLGGTMQGMLPSRNGSVVAICFASDGSRNYFNVTTEEIVLLIAEGKIRTSAMELLERRRNVPVPTFHKEGSNEWRYLGVRYVRRIEKRADYLPYSKAVGRNMTGVRAYRLLTEAEIPELREIEQSLIGAQAETKDISDAYDALLPDEQVEIRREIWARSNAYREYRKKLYELWNGKCSVHGDSVNDLLVASHIKSWSQSTPKQKVNPHNGLLLSVPLDKLFDRHLISFNDDGTILLSSVLAAHTIAIFALASDMRLRWADIDEQHLSGILTFLAIHRQQFYKDMPARTAKKTR